MALHLTNFNVAHQIAGRIRALIARKDNGDVTASTYGPTGATTGNLGRYSLTGGVAISATNPLAGGASGADYRNSTVYTGAADKAQKQTLNSFDGNGTTAELVFQSKTGRQLWLRLR